MVSSTTVTDVPTVSKGALWTGRIISILVVLFMLFDCITKIFQVPQVIEASARVGESMPTKSLGSA